MSDIWPLRTERLEIRPVTTDDLGAMWAYRRLPEVNRWLGPAPDTREKFDEIYATPERLATTLIVTRSDNGRVIGDIMGTPDASPPTNLLAADGTTRDAPRGVQPQGRAAPLG